MISHAMAQRRKEEPQRRRKEAKRPEALRFLCAFASLREKCLPFVAKQL
jgi:hypothetical protein